MPSDQGKLRSVFIAMAVLLLASAVTIFYAGHRAISANEQIVARQAAIDDLPAPLTPQKATACPFTSTTLACKASSPR